MQLPFIGVAYLSVGLYPFLEDIGDDLYLLDAALPLIRRRVARVIERLAIAYPANHYAVTNCGVSYAGTARLARITQFASGLNA